MVEEENLIEDGAAPWTEDPTFYEEDARNNALQYVREKDKSPGMRKH
jgi:hypothetical protein